MTSLSSTISMLSSRPPMLAEWSFDPKPLTAAVHVAMDQEHPIFKSPITDLIVSYLEVNPHTFVYLRPKDYTSLILREIQAIQEIQPQAQREPFPDLAMRSRDSAHCVNLPSYTEHCFLAPIRERLDFIDTEHSFSAPRSRYRELFSDAELDTEHSFSAPTQQTTDADMGRIMIHQPYGGVGGTQPAISCEVLRELEAAVYIMTQALTDDKGESRVVAQPKFF